VSGIEWFRSIGESVTIVTGFIFIVCVLAFRRGIVGEIMAFRRESAIRPKTAAALAV
jgi:branched-chain amino acid transport system permease protein